MKVSVHDMSTFASASCLQLRTAVTVTVITVRRGGGSLRGLLVLHAFSLSSSFARSLIASFCRISQASAWNLKRIAERAWGRTTPSSVP